MVDIALLLVNHGWYWLIKVGSGSNGWWWLIVISEIADNDTWSIDE